MGGGIAGELVAAPAALVEALIRNGTLGRVRRGQIAMTAGSRSDDVYIML